MAEKKELYVWGQVTRAMCAGVLLAFAIRLVLAQHLIDGVLCLAIDLLLVDSLTFNSDRRKMVMRNG